MSSTTADVPQLIRSLHSELIGFARSLHLMKQASLGRRIGPAGLPVIGRLISEGPMRVSALAECTTLDSSTVSRQVDQLVREGLLRRLADPQDGRATLIEATDAGRAEYTEHRQQIAEMLESLLGEWSADQIESFTVSLRRLNEDAAVRLPGLLEQARRAT